MGTRSGTKASPKGVHYYSPTKSSSSPSVTTDVDLTVEQPSKESVAVNVEKKKSVCVVRTYAKMSDDESASSDFVLQSSQAAITYCNKKVLEAKKNDWVSNKESSCARLIPFVELRLRRLQNIDISSNADTNVGVQEACKEPNIKLHTDSSGSTRDGSTFVDDSKSQKSKILSATESSVGSVVKGETDLIEFPCPKKARVTLVKMGTTTGKMPHKQTSTDTSAKRTHTNTVQSNVVIADTKLEQTTVDNLPEAMDIDESAFHRPERQTAPIGQPDVVKNNLIKVTQPNFATNEAHDEKLSNHLQRNVKDSVLERLNPHLKPRESSIDHVTGKAERAVHVIMGGAERDEINQVRRVLERADPSLYPDILKVRHSMYIH